MERQNIFDEAIKAKLGELEDEPSARVWAGVSQSVGMIRPKKSNPWVIRVAAAITILGLVGLGYLLLPNRHDEMRAMALRGRTRAPKIVIVPQDYLGKNGIFLTQNTPKNLQPAPSFSSEVQRNPSVALENRNPIDSPKHVLPDSDSLKFQSPVPFGPGLDPVPDKVIANQEVPIIIQNEVPKPLVPDNKNLDPAMNEKEESESKKAFASAATKRTYKMPTREELTASNLRHKSGAILGAVTNGASEFLGINASYKQKQEEDLKMTAFNADFGLFKIKRVKTIKQ